MEARLSVRKVRGAHLVAAVGKGQRNGSAKIGGPYPQDDPCPPRMTIPSMLRALC